jgi:hypothetical protein
MRDPGPVRPCAGECLSRGDGVGSAGDAIARRQKVPGSPCAWTHSVRRDGLDRASLPRGPCHHLADRGPRVQVCHQAWAWSRICLCGGTRPAEHCVGPSESFEQGQYESASPTCGSGAALWRWGCGSRYLHEFAVVAFDDVWMNCDELPSPHLAVRGARPEKTSRLPVRPLAEFRSSPSQLF